jgi:hypothetical protein
MKFIDRGGGTGRWCWCVSVCVYYMIDKKKKFS